MDRGERFATAEAEGGGAPMSLTLTGIERSGALAREWRRLTRAATFVALLTSPVVFLWFREYLDFALLSSVALTFLSVIAFRGFVDVVVRRFIPWPSLFGQDDARLQESDIVNRRRAWYWRRKFFWASFWLGLITAVWLIQLAIRGPADELTWVETITAILGALPLFLQYLFILPIFFLMNFLILFGPLVFMGISQMRAYEPGDADWGVKLEDVRGQAEAKEEVRRVVSLWQSGEAFEEAGGKRERGLLMLGAPGTGKTMLSKAIATNFNAPFLSMPGSGFAQTFIGMDVVVVRFLAAKAKRLARKWGGQCIVFIDEIDAVGRRRSVLQGAPQKTAGLPSIHDYCFYGPWGALNPTGDLITETREWREKLFEQRAPEPQSPYPPIVQRILHQFPGGMFGGMGQLALNQLLVVMDGIGDPPFWRRFWTNRINTFLDATYVVPVRIWKLPLRLPRPKPRSEQIFFVGATNAPIDSLDPALIRPGRMGRHVWFRTPTKDDRKDIFDLYLAKVAHDENLDTPKRRDEIARITNGYSPAMIEQVCSMALTHAHHEGQRAFRWEHLLEAMTTVETGTAINIEYVPEETKATAIHEAGHAAAGHVYMTRTESTRLSIRMRGRSLGHHMAQEKEERFSWWRSELMGALIRTLGAMAAERVFYGENTDGVGGDVQHATVRAAMMVGASAMAPERIELDGKLDDESTAQARERIMKRFEVIGMQILNRTAGSDAMHQDPIANVLNDPEKRALAAQILGQAYVTAHNFVAANKDAVERIADAAVAKREIYGDELIELLEAVELRAPEVDLLDERSWPKL